MKISNQKPAVLSPVHLQSLSKDINIEKPMRATLVNPLFEPLVANTSVSVQDDDGNTIDQDDAKNQVLQTIIGTLGETVNPTAETTAQKLFTASLLNFNMPVAGRTSELFINQAAARVQLPHPSPSILYSVRGDLIPSAKKLLSAYSNHNAVDISKEYDAFFVNIGYLFHPEIVGFAFPNNTVFTVFKEYVDAQVKVLDPKLDDDTRKQFTDFQALSMNDLTQSLLLRRNGNDKNQPYSFARILVNLSMEFTKNNSREVGPLAFSLNQLYHPRAIVFVNVEEHAHSTEKKITNEWNIINQSLASPIKVLSNKTISKLTTHIRNINKMAAQNGNANKNRKPQRAATVTFAKRSPSTVDITKETIYISKRMEKVNKSSNNVLTHKRSFLRSNRRHPNDPNMSGRIASRVYYPDLHLYLDNSGSISQINWQDSVLLGIKLARKMNCDLYISTFSHVLSNEYKLHVKNRTIAAIWKEFMRVPKVTGMTDYEQIWEYINLSKTRQARLNIVVTDFEFRAPNHHFTHPKNLYYAPCSAMDWDRMVKWAKTFASSVERVDPSIYRKFIGMTNISIK